jgi:NAD(P)H-hydrate epimerase
METVTQNLVRELLPPRPKTAHKGDFGRVLALAGSTGFSGAAWFCAMAAVRGGAGLVTLGLPECVWGVVAPQAPECMCFPLPCDEAGRLDRRAFPWIEEQLGKAGVCVCGPGLGRSPELEKLGSLLMAGDKPLVLDADGIMSARGHILNCPLVLTPHEGEFMRLTGRAAPGAPLSQEAREAMGAAYVKENPCVLVLKGYKTLVFAPGENPRENTTGGPGLAKGGSGDVLAGLIAALIGQGLTPFDAASAGVYIHGLAGDICEREIGERGMTPTDVLSAIPKALLQAGG